MTWTTRQRSDVGALAAIVAGKGPLVVLIHGVGLRAEAWGGQLESLARLARVVAVDLPGHGESALPQLEMTLRHYVDPIADVLAQPAIVIGHSMGAMIALELATRHPKKVRGVCALNAIYQRSPAARAAVMDRAATLDGTTVADPNAPLQRWFGAALSDARNACQDWLQDVDPAGYRAAYRVFAAEDGPSPDALQQMTCPAMFMTGAQEPNSTAAMSKAMADLAPNGEAVVLDGAAHMMPMTHADVVTAKLSTFIERTV